MKVLLIHSHNLNEHGQPGPEYKARLDTWADELVRSRVGHIPLWGGPATPGNEKFWSQAGMDYLINKWISPGNLTRETMWSRETVWELVFARVEHDRDLLNADSQIILLSSDYHLKRLRAIGDLVLGPREIPTQYIGISWFHRSEEAEEVSLTAFESTFAGVAIWDLDKILEALWRKHRLYKNHPLNPYK